MYCRNWNCWPPLTDLDRAQFAGPVVDVLEEMAMDGAKMGEVEGAARDRLKASVGGVKAFDPIKVRGVGQIKRFLRTVVPG
jgi:hypothetical protein